jgi:hypothetical protein
MEGIRTGTPPACMMALMYDCINMTVGCPWLFADWFVVIPISGFIPTIVNQKGLTKKTHGI